MEWFEGIMTFLSLIFVFVIILFLAYLTTKIVASASFKKYKNRNMRLLEGMNLGPQKSLQLVKVGNKIILLALSKDGVTKIESFYPNELLVSEEEYDNKVVTFQDVFNEMKNGFSSFNKSNKLVSNYEEKNDNENSNDDFDEIKTIIRKTRSK